MANIEVVFTQKDFVEGLKALPVTLKGSLYKNKFPQNCLFYQGNGIYSADCWNLIKAYIWGEGVLPKNVGGYWFNPGKFGLGDWNGRQILDKCADISLDFSKLIPGEYLLTDAEDHAGIYIGDCQMTFNGVTNTFNVIECTPIWANGIQPSYVDAKGIRYKYKGGTNTKAGAWQYHAKLPWVDYGIDGPAVRKQMVVTENTPEKIVIELKEINQ